MYNLDSYQEYMEQYMEFMMSDTVNNIMSVLIAVVFSVIAYIMLWHSAGASRSRGWRGCLWAMRG